MLNINADGIITIDAYFSNRGQVDKAIDVLTKARDAFFPKSESFDCVLVYVGEMKISAIKEVRTFTGLSFKDAKDAVDGVERSGSKYVVLRGVNIERAEEVKRNFASFNSTIEIREAA